MTTDERPDANANPAQTSNSPSGLINGHHSKPYSIIETNRDKLRKLGCFVPVIQIPVGKGEPAPVVVQRQKILVFSKAEIDQLPKRKGEKPFIWLELEGKRRRATFVRISDCPNPPGEYSKLGEETYTVLVEFGSLVSAKRVATESVNRDADTQANNFVLNSEPAGSLPSPPIQDAIPTKQVQHSDFQIVDGEDLKQYQGESTLVVAVVDSGVKYDLSNLSDDEDDDEEILCASEPLPAKSGLYHYDERGAYRFRLSTGLPGCNIQAPAIGYCGITDYVELPDNAKKLCVLKHYTPEQIRSSAFDDNRVIRDDKSTSRGGRHGTYITAIINHNTPKEVSVLPVKAFNVGGYGTLFDVLCCLNYVLAQKRAGLPIQVLNASWVGQINADGKRLLDSKFRELEKAGIIVVAAAGNQKRDLGDPALGTLYPACYSTECENVITVTCVERKYKPVKQGTAGKRGGLTGAEQQEILQHMGLDPNQYDAVVDGYEVTQNFSNRLVSVGVYGGLLTETGTKNPFQEVIPTYKEPLQGSSFATARVSAIVASYLAANPTALTSANIASVKEQILTAHTREEATIEPRIHMGRLIS
ncbi:S8/S53 family peptidase [Spirosoma montaniterrae]|uniref:Peptidase S8/S53 domain-containing protein n=1 Tax=Spirosoma montaniterrae TaxID=1178516 RepID=A0A1P9WUV0_9BACT|nr:S8/S53 family peptidase [Spirosoma montaniterrae]AQG79154.1 hypothetical protein AWR27_07355 [Spirosoma montaniterrae]